MTLWPWHRRESPGEGAAAREKAEENLRDARSKWPEVNRVAGSMRDLRRSNHFADLITETMRRNRGTE